MLYLILMCFKCVIEPHKLKVCWCGVVLRRESVRVYEGKREAKRKNEVRTKKKPDSERISQ